MAEYPKGTDKLLNRPICRGCGGNAFKPAVRLNKSLEHPAYEILECVTCGLFVGHAMKCEVASVGGLFYFIHRVWNSAHRLLAGRRVTAIMSLIV